MCVRDTSRGAKREWATILALASQGAALQQTPLAPPVVAVMSSGFNFVVHHTVPQAMAFLAQWPLALFGDSQWLEAHLDLLRTQPAAVLALLDFMTPRLQAELEGFFGAFSGGPVRCELTGMLASGPRDAASFIRHRRELLANALASSTLGIREQMNSFEIDISNCHIRSQRCCAAVAPLSEPPHVLVALLV